MFKRFLSIMVFVATIFSLPVLASVSVEYQNNKESVDKWISPRLKISNEGSEAISLDEIVVDYYFYEPDNDLASYDARVFYYAPSGDESGNVAAVAVNLAALSEVSFGDGTKANLVATVSFNGGDTLPAGDFAKVVVGIHRTDWSLLNSLDDYSFIDATDYVGNTKIVVRNSVTGELLWGTPAVDSDSFSVLWDGGYGDPEGGDSQTGHEIYEVSDGGFISLVKKVSDDREGGPTYYEFSAVKLGADGTVEWFTDFDNIQDMQLIELPAGYLLVARNEQSKFKTYLIDDSGQQISQATFGTVGPLKNTVTVGSTHFALTERAIMKVRSDGSVAGRMTFNYGDGHKLVDIVATEDGGFGLIGVDGASVGFIGKYLANGSQIWKTSQSFKMSKLTLQSNGQFVTAGLSETGFHVNLFDGQGRNNGGFGVNMGSLNSRVQLTNLAFVDGGVVVVRELEGHKIVKFDYSAQQVWAREVPLKLDEMCSGCGWYAGLQTVKETSDGSLIYTGWQEYDVNYSSIWFLKTDAQGI